MIASLPQDDRESRASGEELRVERLSMRFGGVHVLNDISFTLPARAIVGIIGPNGAGKTTLINVICGKHRPTGGRVVLGAREITGVPAYRLLHRGLARSFQQTNVFRRATVRENIARAAQFAYASGSPQQEVRELLGRFDLANRLDVQADELPYGLQKMLGLLMAYVSRPSVLLLDEPAAGLERTERFRVDEFVQAAQSRGTSVLIVEHDMDLIRRLCPHIVVINAGTALAEGAPAEVLARPDVVAAYVGTAEEDADDEGGAKC